MRVGSAWVFPGVNSRVIGAFLDGVEI